MAKQEAAFMLNSLSDKQLDSILDSACRINIWEGSVRSGKTIASILRWAEYLTNNPPVGGTYAMIGKTQTTLQRNIIDPMMMLFPNECEFKRGTGEFIFRGVQVEVLGASDERAQDKIRGRTMAGAYGDEVSLWPESFWTMLLSRLSVKGAKLFVTTNPDSPYHWLKKGFIDRVGDLDVSVFHFKLEDNEALDPAYVNSLKKEYTGLWYKRFIDGEWVQAEGAIYDMFDPSRHVVDVPDVFNINYDLTYRKRPVGSSQLPPVRFFASCDYGTANATTFGLFCYRGQKPPVYMLKEYYYDGRKSGKQKTDGDYADDMVEFLGALRGKAPVYIDPSALSFITELKKRGVHVIEADNSVIDGIRFMGMMLRDGHFFIDKNCKNAIEEIQGYVWDDKAQQKGEDKPKKEHDHSCDMMRYGLFSHFYRKGEGIIAGLNYK